MKCYNRNTPEYQALMLEYDSNVAVDSIINKWQTTHKTEDFPTLADANVMLKTMKTAFSLKKRKFAESVLANLSRKNLISRWNDGYYVNNSNGITREYDAPTLAKNLRRVKDYLEFKNIPLDAVDIERTKKAYRISIDQNIFTKKDILEETRENDGTHVADVVQHLGRMFPQLDIEVASVAAAQEYYDNLPKWQKAKVPFSQVKSFYVDGKAMLVKGRVTTETAIEEILHPFVDAIKVDNQGLWNGLLKEAKNNFPELNVQIEDAYTEKRGFNQTQRDLELVTQALSRHFNKEYKSQPTKAWAQKIKEMLQWLMNVINDLHKYLTGKGVKVSAIKSTTTMTDVAKLLNTKDLEFTIERIVDRKVRYSLRPDQQVMLDKIKDHANDLQKDLIDKMFFLARTSKKSAGDALSANVKDLTGSDALVVLNDENHEYYDLETGGQYLSATTAIKGAFPDQESKQLNLDLGNDFDKIAEGLAAGLNYNEIAPKLKIINRSLDEMGVPLAYTAYNQLLGALETIKANGSVIVPQVVFADPQAAFEYDGKEYQGIAGTADLVVISPEGKIGIIDLKTGKTPIRSAGHKHQYTLENGGILAEKGVEKLSTEQQHGVQVNLYRRMAENMGYEVLDEQAFGISTLHLNVDVEGKGKGQVFKDKFFFDGWVPHAPSRNKIYVDMIVPEKVNEMSQNQINEALKKAGVDNPTQDPNFLTVDAEMPEGGTSGTMYDVLFKSLIDFKKGLLKRKEAIERVKGDTFLDRSRGEALEQVQEAMSSIAVALDQGATAVEVVYSELLQDAIKEVRKFKKYVQDPANFNKDEYINYVLNFANFVETYRGLYSVEDAGLLNETQNKLIVTLMSELNTLQTITSPDGTRSVGLIDEAIDNYVRSFVIDNTNRDMTEEDLDELMTTAKDMGLWEYNTYDMATSSDQLLQLMDKLYKRKKFEVLDRIDARNDAIRATLSKLVKLSPGRKVDYDFMLQEDQSRYVQEIGYDYWRDRSDLRNNLMDEEGVWKDYIFIEDLETARPEDIKYNKELFEAKKKYREFLRPERKGNDGPVDGEHHRYTQAFKDERAKFQQFRNVGTNGYWERKKGVSDIAYQRFLARNYDTIETNFAVYDSNNNFTGQTRIDTMQVPKRKHTEIRSITASGKDMRDAKWVKLMNPTNALEEAQKEFYLMWKKHFEDELLKKLPVGVRDQMMGKVPLVKDTLYQNIKDKPNIVGRLWSKATRTATDMFTATGTSKKVVVDETGNFIDTLPIFFVGNPRSEKALQSVEDEIRALKKEYNKGKLTILKYETAKKDLEMKKARIRSMPTKDEISKDLGSSLLAFSMMAENYEVMGQIEDTLKAMIKVLEKRNYNPGSGQKLLKSVKGKLEEVGVPGVSSSGEANTVRRAKKWMKMVYYNNDQMTRSIFDKITSGLIRYSSLSYVAWNPFGNINNYTIGRINNLIETAGGRFYSRKAYARAAAEFNKRALPDVVRKTAFLTTAKQYEEYKPQSKYEALVQHYRMMDNKADIRESGQVRGKESFASKALNFGYIGQDAAEYNVQTKVGMAILMTKQIKNSETGETMSLFDAYQLNGDGEVTLKPGFDTLIDEQNNKIKEFNDNERYDIRNEIREVNKQIHGNYAYEDRMVIQTHAMGELVAQFHKWVVPALKARFRPEYFDENVGWLEGRYISALHFLKYATTHITEVQKWGTNFQEQYGGGQKGKMKMLNVYRTLGEIGFMFTSFFMITILQNLFEDDDDDSLLVQKMENALIYQANRTYKELMQFMPWTPTGAVQMFQMVGSPIASTRTLGEMAEAFDATIGYMHGKMFLSEKEFKTNSDLVYQNRPKKGKLKVVKQWKDAVPILYGIQRWEGYEKEKDYYIK